MSQAELGRRLGVSFQQMQKYEKGLDRVAASTLQGIAAALGVHPGSFYDDVPTPAGRVPEVRAALKAAEVLQQIRKPRVLNRILALAQALVDADDDESGPKTNDSGEIH